jgi:hypothetical protein
VWVGVSVAVGVALNVGVSVGVSVGVPVGVAASYPLESVAVSVASRWPWRLDLACRSVTQWESACRSRGRSGRRVHRESRSVSRSAWPWA